ncbi:MAG: ribonuclease-3 [Patiriisocius sp.]|jgi:ribonuclease-3
MESLVSDEFMASIKNIFSSRAEKDGDFFLAIKKLLGFKPKDISIYKEAFTHRSTNTTSSQGHAQNYERMEFLGDAMLSAVIAAHLFNEVPGGNEGYLTKMRSKVVSREHLNELGRDLQLINHLKTTIPLSQFGGNIHGNVFEALVGAIYLDRGYRSCEKFIDKRVIKPYVDIEKLEGKIISYKSLFIEWCQKHKKQFKFAVYEDTGIDKLKHFAVKLYLDDEIVGKARATSKKKAEETASKRAYFKLQVAIDKDF